MDPLSLEEQEIGLGVGELGMPAQDTGRASRWREPSDPDQFWHLRKKRCKGSNWVERASTGMAVLLLENLGWPNAESLRKKFPARGVPHQASIASSSYIWSLAGNSPEELWPLVQYISEGSRAGGSQSTPQRGFFWRGIWVVQFHDCHTIFPRAFLFYCIIHIYINKNAKKPFTKAHSNVTKFSPVYPSMP